MAVASAPPPSGGMTISRRTLRTQFPGFTLISDTHIGASSFDEELLVYELDRARANKDRIQVNGDVFDLILPSDRRRYRPDAIHPRLQGRADIVNAAVDWAVEIFKPYADLIDVIGIGNHESACESHSATDPVLALIKALSPRRIDHGGYCGLTIYDLPDGKTLTFFRHHGWGKGGSLSKSVTDWNQMLWIEGADVLWLGHLHTRLTAHLVKMVIPATGCEPILRDVRLVRTGSYLHTYRGQSQSDLQAHGRKANYASDAGLPCYGLGGARVFLEAGPRHERVIRILQ